MDSIQSSTQNFTQTHDQIYGFKPKQSYVKPVILFLSITVTLGIFVYFAFQNEKLQKHVSSLSVSPTTQASSPLLQSGSPTPQAAPSILIQRDETAGWKTFTNENFSYIVKYPNDWITIPMILKGSRTEAVGMHGSELQGKSMYLHSRYPDTPTPPFLQIEVFPNETIESYDLRKQGRPNSQEAKVEGERSIISKQKSQPEPGTNITEEGYRYSWFVFNSKTGAIYDIICYEDLGTINLCNQILGTFRFI